ncbi:SH3 domain-containing protein [Baekduia sp. Peel2402]|uniref:SH3 domain-containing protein n=1 Tax=Baekduia sp. Peel2402 TaxID=3458296 RepID=UPI00403E66F6
MRSSALARRARAAIVLTIAALALAHGAPSASAAARTVTICAPRVTLYESPGGAKVGILHAGDRVRVLTRGAHKPWWRVVAAFGTRGWLRSSAICGRRR